MNEGTNMYMPVAPVGNGFGDGLGNNGWWILLLLFAMNGGWGFGNGYGNQDMGYLYANQTQNDVNRGFADMNLQNQLTNLNNSVANGFAAAEVARCNRAMNQMQTQYQNTIDQLQGMNNINMSLQQCCCENRLATANTQAIVQSEASQNRFQDAANTRDIITNATANTQAILDKLCQLELDGMRNQLADRDRQISSLQNQVSLANLASSQANQTKEIMTDNAAQTQYIVNRVAPYPIPSYQVSNPYTSQATCGCGY